MQSPPTPSRSADHRDVLPEHAEGHGDKLFEAVCKLGLEGIVSKKLDAPYKSGPSKAWLKIKNPKAPAATLRYRRNV